MKIAFHAPLKSPDHPVPSGDRLMARLLVAALERGGHSVEVASQLRSFCRDPQAEDADILTAADAEIARIDGLWRATRPPDLWFCYHPYYKAPDLIGPSLARRFAIPYVTAEASYSPRRNVGLWSGLQSRVLDAIELAAVNICMTERDAQGLRAAAQGARLARLKPFIDPSAFLVHEPAPEPGRLVTVAMMRPGDKMDSYVMLAEALKRLEALPWTLTVIGGGSTQAEVRALFAGFAQGRIVWQGERTTAEIASVLSTSAVYVWPGCGEAYGLAYLEAQASGLPVVAQRIAGVPEVVEEGRTGLLTPAGDIDAYADAIASLLTDGPRRLSLGQAARRLIAGERSLDRAAHELDRILKIVLAEDRR